MKNKPFFTAQVIPVIDDKTLAVHNWMKNLDDDNKMRFAINWRMPHTLFNVACAIRGEHDSLQNVDWYKIFQTRDLGMWSHGGAVYVQSF